MNLCCILSIVTSLRKNIQGITGSSAAFPQASGMKWKRYQPLFPTQMCSSPVVWMSAVSRVKHPVRHIVAHSAAISGRKLDPDFD